MKKKIKPSYQTLERKIRKLKSDVEYQHIMALFWRREWDAMRKALQESLSRRPKP